MEKENIFTKTKNFMKEMQLMDIDMAKGLIIIKMETFIQGIGNLI